MPSTLPHTPQLIAARSCRIACGLVAMLLVLSLTPVSARHAAASGPAEAPQAGDVVLLDFAADWCGPCRAMAPLLQGIEQAGWPVRHVDVDQEHDLVRRFGVAGVPCYILLVRGHEVGRIDGATTQQKLEGLLAKGLQPGAAATLAAQAAPGHQAATVPGIPLSTTPAAEALTIETPPPPRGSDAAVILPNHRGPAPTALVADGQRGQIAQPFAGADPAATAAIPHPDQSAIQSRLLAATARLRVQDPQGSSRGTGTVIDCRQGEALILTCAHIFRDSGGEGRIGVDLFGAHDARGLAGQLVAWDLDRDVALVSVFTDAQIQPARVAGSARELAVGEQVASVGCDGGADPTVQFSQITAVDKYLGPPNVQVAGQPVPGRSGGGLFALDGSLIGVCNAADPADKEGLYAALSAVHEQLDEAGLSFVYRATYPSTGPAPLADTTPAMPESMPTVAFDRRDRTDAVPTSTTADPSAAAATALAAHASSLTPGEQALLAEVRQHRGQAEVICIVRPHGAESSSEVFVLSGAGEDFVDHLSAAHGQVSAAVPAAARAEQPLHQPTAVLQGTASPPRMASAAPAAPQ